MSLAHFAEAARRTSQEVRGLTRSILGATAVRAASTPAATARAVQRAIERKQAPELIKALKKELK